MLNALAVLLGGIGTTLITGVFLALKWRQPDPEPEEPLMFACEAPSPDDSMMCDLEFGHWGWHRNAETQWFGDAWGVSQWENTQEAPAAEQDPTMSATQWERKRERPQRQVKRPKYRKPARQPEEQPPLSRAEKRRIKRGQKAITAPARTNPTPEQMAAVRSNLHRMSEHRRQQIQQAEIQKTIDIQNFQKIIGPQPLKFAVGAMGTRRPLDRVQPITVTVAKGR